MLLICSCFRNAAIIACTVPCYRYPMLICMQSARGDVVEWFSGIGYWCERFSVEFPVRSLSCVVQQDPLSAFDSILSLRRVLYGIAVG